MTIQILLVLALLVSVNTLIWAEGSKDFVNYPGYRMFLDTRDAQQLKVYAGEGEYINVGSSHVGIQGGFIQVYRPNGTLAATYDNTGGSTGLGIINTNVQELAGPTGGGTTNGTGYVPGVVQVPAGQAGIWTIVFDFPSYVNTSFSNILNNAPWTRGANQPNSRRVVLAWDVTVTTGGAGNTGGTAIEGRLYSNEHISLINGNGFNTSPIFYVLTDDGYLYQVNINNADPFRFPISSNSLGLVNGNGDPIYLSKPEAAFTRDDTPANWSPNNLYLYEPQAEDDAGLGLINNKIFFNIPDSNMPSFAQVTDIYRANTHTTWLYSPVQVLNLNSTSIVGANPGGSPCATGAFQFGKGGYFIFDTNTGGSITLQLDLNNNGIYTDPVDVTIEGVLSNGVDSIFWNGSDGLGVPIPIQDSFTFNYQGTIRFGELHIALTDVENNSGGVTFEWLNAPPGYPTDQFYYDHSDVGGPTSAPTPPGTPGDAQPTTIPYMYTGNAGNDQYLDQWFFIEFTIDNTPVVINIVQDCVCDNVTPELTGTGAGDICSGQDLNLTATNSVTGIGDLLYSWSGPASYIFTETIGATDTSTATVNNITSVNAGTYQVIAATSAGCADTLSYAINVNPTPSALLLIGGGDYCAGQDVILTATNTVLVLDTISYTWTGPGVSPPNDQGSVPGDAPIILSLPNIQENAEGTYTLVMTSDLGCASDPISTTVTVNATPVITPVSGGGSYCFDEDVTLLATNSAAGVTTMVCIWNGPNLFNVTQNLNGNDPITLSLNNVNNSFEGTYTVICTTIGGCASAPVTFDVAVNANPEINAISPNGTFCEGSPVTLTALNVNPDTGPITYLWTGPNPANTLFPFSGPLTPQVGPFEVTIPSLTLADAGTYTLVLTTLGGCESVPQSVNIAVSPAPDISITGGGDACVGQDVVLSASNTLPGVGLSDFAWSSPDGTLLATGTVTGNAPFSLNLDDVDINDSGVYTVTNTIVATGCTASATVTLNVFPGLNIFDETSDSTYCEFESVLLTATNSVDAGDLTYTWNGPNGIILGPFTVGSFEPLTAIFEATPAHSGTWTLNVTSTLGCSSNNVTVEVTVLPGVRITSVTGGGTYCVGDEVNLNGTGEGSAPGVDYNWTDPTPTIVGSGTNVPPTGPFPGTGTTNVPGTYILEVVAPSGCSDSETVNVTFNALPEVVVLNNDTTLCNLDTLEICGQALTANIGAFTYQWITGNGTVLNGIGNGNDPFCQILLPMQNYGEGTYSLTITANGCTSLVDTFHVTLNPNPTISIISGAGTYCVGQTADICFTNTNPAAVGFFYTYVLPNGTVINGQTLTNDTICIPVTTSGTICVSIESFEGCVSSLACATVTFEPSASLNVLPTVEVCANENLTLSGTNTLPCSGNFTYSWNGPNGYTFTGVAPCSGPFTAVVPIPVAGGEYCLIAPLNSTCPDTACTTVTVNPVPTVTAGGITGGGTFCEGEDIVLSAVITISDNSPITYTWFKGITPIPGQTGTVPSGSTVTLDLGPALLTDEGEYCLRVVSNQGCTGAPLTCVQVNVDPKPNIISVSGGGVYCEGVNVSLNGIGTPGLGNVSYMWMDPDGVAIFTSGNNIPSSGPFPATINNITVQDAGEYTLIVKLGNCSDTAVVVVEVNPKPVITVQSGNGTFCEGSEVIYSFEIDPNGAASVDWSFSCPGFDTSGTVTTVTVISFTKVVTSTTTCTITAESDLGCEAEPKQIVTTIQQIDKPVLSASTTVLCTNDELTLSTTAQQGTNVDYEWFKDGVSIGTTTVSTFDVVPPASGSYTVTVTVDGCAETSDPVVVAQPTAPVAEDDNYEGTAPNPVSGNVTDNDTAPDAVVASVVDPIDGLDFNSDGTFTYTPAVPPLPLVTFNYQLCLADCPDVCDEATVTITYDVDCEVPNVITPNGDNTNDVLIIDCLLVPPGTTPPPNSRLRIFNRWGDEIQSFEPYDNDKGWDATYGSDKKPVPAATYFFLFEYDKTSGNDPISGYIKVAR